MIRIGNLSGLVELIFIHVDELRIVTVFRFPINQLVLHAKVDSPDHDPDPDRDPDPDPDRDHDHDHDPDPDPDHDHDHDRDPSIAAVIFAPSAICVSKGTYLQLILG